MKGSALLPVMPSNLFLLPPPTLPPPPPMAITGGAVWVAHSVWSLKRGKDVRRKPIRFHAGAKWPRKQS